MAKSPSHQFGQIIGDVLEKAIRPALERIAEQHQLFLDSKRSRKARNGKSKVSWKDSKGNFHDLDYVLESGGTEDQIGNPKAFIEIAWRRYTKHSRNKAQEIQGAITPLVEQYSSFHPFLGAVLAGVFTQASLSQLRSHGFTLLFFPYESVVSAFKAAGIDASFDENSTDAEMSHKVRKYQSLSPKLQNLIPTSLLRRHRKEVIDFITALQVTLTRKVTGIYVLPLHGLENVLSRVADAIDFIVNCDETKLAGNFIRYEITVRYNNGDEIRGQFKDKSTAIGFLRSMH